MALDPTLETTVFERLRTAASDPEITRCIKAIERLVGYRIPGERFDSISRFHTFITSPQPKYVTAWRADPRLEQKWYRAHVGVILNSVPRVLAAAHYHAERLGELETTVTELLEASSFKERLSPTMSLGPGSNDKMDFEYQAFVLAYRRCLDYLAGALASYFKIEANSFRTLPKSIAKGKPAKVAEAISKAQFASCRVTWVRSCRGSQVGAKQDCPLRIRFGGRHQPHGAWLLPSWRRRGTLYFRNLGRQEAGESSG
jgi:hypothetical protein